MLQIRKLTEIDPKGHVILGEKFVGITDNCCFLVITVTEPKITGILSCEDIRKNANTKSEVEQFTESGVTINLPKIGFESYLIPLVQNYRPFFWQDLPSYMEKHIGSLREWDIRSTILRDMETLVKELKAKISKEDWKSKKPIVSMLFEGDGKIYTQVTLNDGKKYKSVLSKDFGYRGRAFHLCWSRLKKLHKASSGNLMFSRILIHPTDPQLFPTIFGQKHYTGYFFGIMPRSI